VRRLSWILVAAFTAACTKDSVGLRPDTRGGGGVTGVTLLVRNATCHAGGCDSLEVLAFPSDQPETPGGYWSLDIGLVTTPSACLTLPPSAKFLVISEPARSSADTSTTTWTSTIALSLGALKPGSPALFASPSTATFVPGDATGWSITLPTGSYAAPGPACTP